MKTTAIIRKVDKLGRLILPAEFRRMLHLQVKDRVEIFTEDEKIILQKYQPDYPCALTGKVSDENFFLTKKNIVVSPKGALKLYEQLEAYLQQQK